MKKIVIYFTLMVLQGAYAPLPGTFQWHPRLGIDLAIPTTEVQFFVNKPTMDNIRRGLVVMFDGYQAGLTVIAMTAGISIGQTYMKTLDPLSSYYYTNVYRWALRYISMLPLWLGGQETNFVETQRVWHKRFYNTESFLPKWAEKALFFVDKNSWAEERLDFKRFKKYAEGAFGKHFRFPSKKWNKNKSHLTEETEEEQLVSQSIDISMSEDQGK